MLGLHCTQDRQSGKSTQECADAEAKMREINMAYRRIQLQHGEVDETVTDPEKDMPTESTSPAGEGGGQRHKKGKKGRHDNSDSVNKESKEEKEFKERCRQELKRLDAELAAAKRRSKSAVRAAPIRSGKKGKRKDHKGSIHKDKEVTSDPHAPQNAPVARGNEKHPLDDEGKASEAVTPAKEPDVSQPQTEAVDHQAQPSGNVESPSISVYDQSVHPLAVAIRLDLICAFWGLLRPGDDFDDEHGEYSLTDHLDEDNNNVLHYCVYYSRPDIGSSVVSNASYQWSALVFEKNRLGLRPSEVPCRVTTASVTESNSDGGRTTATAASDHRKIVDELKRLEESEEEYRAAQRDRRIDWHSAAVALCEVVGIGLCVRLIAAVSGVHILGSYECIMVSLWRIAPGVHLLNEGNMGTSVVCLICGLRLFMYFSWFALISGVFLCGVGAFGLYCCFPFAIDLIIALVLILYNLVALCVGIVALPAVGVGRMFEKSVVPKYEMFWGEENRKKAQLILKQAKKGIVFCMAWLVVSLICAFGKVFGIIWG